MGRLNFQHADFVAGLGLYSDAIAYNTLKQLDPEVPTLYFDVAGKIPSCSYGFIGISANGWSTTRPWAPPTNDAPVQLGAHRQRLSPVVGMRTCTSGMLIVALETKVRCRVRRAHATAQGGQRG